MAIEANLEDIRRRLTTAQQEEARNQVLRESAQRERDAALKTLKAEFDVDTLDAAILVRKKLKAKQEADLKALAAELDKLERHG